MNPTVEFHMTGARIAALQILSADFIAPLVEHIGIGAPAERETVRNLARDAYDALLDGVTNIYHINYTASRIAAITKSFLNAAENAGQEAATHVRELIELLAAAEINTGSAHNHLSYVLSLKFYMGSAEAEFPTELDPTCVEKIKVAFAEGDSQVAALRVRVSGAPFSVCVAP